MSTEETAQEAAPSGSTTISDAASAIKESADEHSSNPEGAFVRDGDRDIFDRILADRNQADPEEPEEAPEPAAEEKAAEAPVEAEKEQGTEEAPVLSEETLRALRRAKTPQSVIDAMSQEDADAWALQLKEVQDDADKAFSKVKDLERQLDEEAESDDGTSEPEDSEGGTDFEPVTLSADDVTPLIERLGLDGDEEATGELVEAFNVVVSAIDKVHQQRAPREDPRVEGLQSAVQAMALRMAREDLGRRYPETREDESKFTAVIEKFQKLYKTGDYSEDEAMHDAATLVLGKAKDSEPPKKEVETAKPPKEAQPTVNTARPPEPELSPEDRDRKVYNQILAKRQGQAV